MAVSFFIRLHVFGLAGLAFGEHRVDDARELVRSRRDRLACAQACGQSALIGPQAALAAREPHGCELERTRHRVSPALARAG